MVINIKEQIKESTEEQYDNSRFIENLKEFQELSQVDSYLLQDAENFWDADCYVDLIKELGELTSINIDNISYNVAERWNFSFTINDSPTNISIEDPHTDWFSEEFMELFNHELKYAGYSESICNAYVDGFENMDQCFNMVFINDETYNKLKNHPKRYAFNENDSL